jgi:hypothetical protein
MNVAGPLHTTDFMKEKEPCHGGESVVAKAVNKG